MGLVQSVRGQLFESVENGSRTGGLARAEASDGSNAFLGGNLKASAKTYCWRRRSAQVLATSRQQAWPWSMWQG